MDAAALYGFDRVGELNYTRPKKLRPAIGGWLAARDPVWDGEGWGCDRVACPVIL